MVLRDSTDAELDAFDDVCTRLGGFDARIDPEWADGYLTALAAGPRAVPLHEWLPRMAGDAFERAFADPVAVTGAQAALQARMQVLASHLDAEDLLDVPDALRLQPRVSVWDQPAADEPDAPALGARWATGFLDALHDFGEDWAHPADLADGDGEARDEMLQQLRWLLAAPDDPAFKAHVQAHFNDGLATREDLVDAACYAVQDLRLWWLDHAPRPATRRVAPRPGRNDPCPCGSGLKFKKCHGRGG